LIEPKLSVNAVCALSA